MTPVYCHKNNTGERACKRDEEVGARAQEKEHVKQILPSSFGPDVCCVSHRSDAALYSRNPNSSQGNTQIDLAQDVCRV